MIPARAYCCLASVHVVPSSVSDPTHTHTYLHSNRFGVWFLLLFASGNRQKKPNPNFLLCVGV